MFLLFFLKSGTSSRKSYKLFPDLRILSFSDKNIASKLKILLHVPKHSKNASLNREPFLIVHQKLSL